MRLTLRLALVILAAVLPVIAVEIYNAYALIDRTRAEARASAEQYSRLAAWEMQRLIDGYRAVMTTVAAAPLIRAGDWAECEDFVSALSSSVPGLAGLGVADRDGNVRCAHGFPEGALAADRLYFQRAVAANTFIVGTYTITRVSKKAVLPFATPLRDANGEIVGVVAAGLDLGWLSDSLRERGVPPDGSLTIADADGVILARQPLPEKFVGTRIPDAYQYLLHEKKAGAIEVVSQDGTRRTLGYQPLSVPLEGIYVSAGLAVETSYAGAFSATFRALAVAFAAAAMAILVSWYISRRFVTDPVASLVRVAERWRAGDMQARSGLTGSDEFGQLGAAFDSAIEQAKKREDRITLLVREITHRVKNQMSVMASMARQSGRNAASVADFQKAFSNRIMALSRSHDLVFADAGEARLRNLVEAQLAPFAGSGRLRISGPEILIDPQATQYLGMALHELATNAVKYGALSKEGGQVEISWDVPRVDAANVLRIAWRESGGPEVAQPPSEGFGTVVLDKIVGSALGGQTSFTLERSGAVWTCEFTEHFSLAPAETPRAAS